MVNGMDHPEQRKADGRPLEQPAKIHHLDELLAAKLFERFVIFCEVLLVPGGDLLRRLHRVRNRGGVSVEHTVDYRLEKAVLRNGDVADELNGVLGYGVREIGRASCRERV